MAFRRRLVRLFALTALLFGLVGLRVVELQTIEGAKWEAVAAASRTRRVARPAPRGSIVDATGETLARDVPVFQIATLPYEWKYRARSRCVACGALRFHTPGGRPSGPCRCRLPDRAYEQLGLGDTTPLDEVLGLEPGTLAARAEARLQAIEAMVQDLRRRLEASGTAAFLISDELRIYEVDMLHRPYVLVGRVDEERVEPLCRLLELSSEARFRGFALQTDLRRDYPHGDLAAQLLGYVSAVQDEAEYDRLQAQYGDHVTLSTRVGRTGVERAHDALLLGRRGLETQGRDEDGSFTVVLDEVPPERGQTLQLGITVEACLRAQQALADHGDAGDYYPRTQPSGGFVAMYADDGTIVSWGEIPRFDLQDDLGTLFHPAFTKAQYDVETGAWQLPDGTEPPDGLDEMGWRRRIAKPAPVHMSRNAQIAVEPGSTLKPFIGLCFLETGRPLPWDRGHPFPCQGHGGSPGCHSHPAVDFEGSIECSCNKFYAYICRDSELWPLVRHSIGRRLAQFGLGQVPGSDVGSQTAGLWLRDWIDFDLAGAGRAAVVEATEALREAGVTVHLDPRPGLPSIVAGRGPERLVPVLALALRQAARTVPGGRLGLRMEVVGRRDRFVHVRFEVIAVRAEDEAAADPKPVSLGDLERAVSGLGGTLERSTPRPDVASLAFEVAYHDAIGRPDRSEAPSILPDDGRNVAIGQGPVMVTPLQMVRAVGVFANGGRLVTPHVGVAADGVPLPWPVEDLEIDPAHLERVRDGMRRVLTGAHGTARGSATWRTIDAEVFGKTGTSQTGNWWTPGGRPESGSGPWHHWFVGFAERPGTRPIAFAAVLHSRMESAAGKTAAKVAYDWLTWWYARGGGAR